MNEAYLSLTEVSRILQMSKSTLYKYVELNKIPNFKIGNRIRFSPTDLTNWITEKKKEGN